MFKTINSDLCHDNILQNLEPKLRFNPKRDYKEWKKEVSQKLTELLGMEHMKANVCELNVEVEEEIEKEGYRRIRFTFESEKGCTVPCYLLIPKGERGKKYPLAIILQGHSTGFHLSIGIAKEPGDEKKINDRGILAEQAVENGFACLCIEQRGMGESLSPKCADKEGHRCAIPALTAINLGRTLIGERVFDVMRGIDALKSFEHLGLDLEKIIITGNSGGGTVSYYAACIDERIKISIPSCSVCKFKDSIMAMSHCVCNFIPDICNWFEMEDIACLIAPRPLIVVAGQKDAIFPIEPTRQTFEVIKEIYKAAGVEENCRLVETPMHHFWCKDLVWEAIREQKAKLGW